jgi:YD repeat-containing protein
VRAGLLAAACCAALPIAACGSAKKNLVPKLVLGPAERVASIPAHDPLQQGVAVVFLMPETTLTVDVVSGRLFAPEKKVIVINGDVVERETSPSAARGDHERMIGLVDPQFHNQIFAYRNNGIPGVPGWTPRWGRAPAPAPGKLPVWVPPRLITRSGRPIAVVLADGQRVELKTDGHGRIVSLRWATPRREALVATIRYGKGATTISAPAGVVRTYHYDPRHLITRVDAPGAAAHSRNDTADGRLDSQATERMLAYRLRSGTPERYAAYETAPNAINDNYLDYAATDGYQRYGVPTLADMRRVDDALRKSGVLDVAEAIPVLNDRVEDYVDGKYYDPVANGLHHACSLEVWVYRVTYGHKLTSGEITTVARRLSRVPKHWIYIDYSDVDNLSCGSFL